MDPERIQYSKLNDTQTATVYVVYVKWCEIADLVDVIVNILVFFIKYILERDILQSAFNSMSVINKTLEKKKKKEMLTVSENVICLTIYVKCLKIEMW
jgi:hypothetical protein